jgi:copper(I)-binding protein
VAGPNGTTTFIVQFAPGAVGPRSAVIHIASNDGNENPFDITLTGTGIAPEIAVEQPAGTNIADAGAKDFGSVNVGSNTSLSFTIKNTGTANLTGLAITKDGTNPADFTVTSSPVAPVAGPNGTTTFTVQFAPGAVGPRSAVIRIASNDGDENPFDITLTGTGIAPEIAVEQPVGTNIADAGAKAFGSVNVGSNTSLTFTIKNTGTADLTGLAITKDGTNPADFTVTSSPAAPVAGPSGTTTFIVQFAPGAVGPRSAIIRIASNDGDENPFDITLTGTGIVPEIAVEQPVGTNIPDAGAKDFGSVNVGSNTSLTFTIKNTGTAELTGLAITKDGTNPADFTLTSSPVAPVAGPNGTTTFIVQFAPGAVGPRSAVIHIASNDGDENPFDITLTGTGMFFDDFDPAQTPALWAQFGGSVEANSNGQAAGSGSTGNSLWFGGDGSRYATTQPIDSRTGGGVSFLFAIANGTSSPWESADDGEDVVLEYANDGTNFVQIGGPYNNRAWQKHVLEIPAPARTMATRFRFRQLSNSGAAYDHWAIDDVQIGSSVVVAPEIAVEQPAGTGLTDGSSTVNFHLEGNDLNCSRTLVIRNVGTTDLTINEVTMDGTNAADFSLGSPGASTLAPGAATTLTVTFTPGGVGARTAAIHIASNDGDENPFDINLTGTGLLTAIQSWRQTYFGTTSNTGNSEDTADPYHTGIPNLLVFAFAGPNQNPVSAKVSQLPQMQQSGGNLLYSFTQPAGVSGVTYGAEWSQTLLSGSWTAVADTGTPPQHTFSVPIGSNTKLFMRLKVTNP